MTNPPNVEMIEGEVVVRLADGWTIRSSHPKFCAGEYVRICRPDGSEYMYWDSAEWQEAPEEVMGAIICAAGGQRPNNIPEDS